MQKKTITIANFELDKKTFLIIFVGFFVVLYFIFYSVFGTKGIIKYFALKRELNTKIATQTDLQNKLQEKQNLVKKMSVESLDLDLLDEQTRKNLGYAGKNEIVIYDRKNN